MASLNKVQIIGNLGADPDLKYLPSGSAVINFSVATSEKWNDKETGEKRERTEWHRVSFFGKAAEILGEYLQKGSAIYVEGSLQTRKWQDKEGNDRYTTEIKGRDFQFLGGNQQRDGGENRSQPANNQQQSRSQPAGPKQDDFDDDIPF